MLAFVRNQLSRYPLYLGVGIAVIAAIALSPHPRPQLGEQRVGTLTCGRLVELGLALLHTLLGFGCQCVALLFDFVEESHGGSPFA